MPGKHRRPCRPRFGPNRLTAGRHMLPGVTAEAFTELRLQLQLTN